MKYLCSFIAEDMKCTNDKPTVCGPRKKEIDK